MNDERGVRGGMLIYEGTLLIFLHTSLFPLTSSQRQMARTMFTLLDRNGSTTLDIDEIASAMKEVGMTMPIQLLKMVRKGRNGCCQRNICAKVAGL